MTISPCPMRHGPRTRFFNKNINARTSNIKAINQRTRQSQQNTFVCAYVLPFSFAIVIILLDCIKQFHVLQFSFQPSSICVHAGPMTKNVSLLMFRDINVFMTLPVA